jgi:hypothetical protein
MDDNCFHDKKCFRDHDLTKVSEVGEDVISGARLSIQGLVWLLMPGTGGSAPRVP